MSIDRISQTRSIWPLELNPKLIFINDTSETNQLSTFDKDPEVVKATFDRVITEIFDEVFPGLLDLKPDQRHVIAYNLVSDMHSEIVLVFVKEASDLNLSDQIIVQDRMSGKNRGEWIYQSTDGKNGQIVKISCDDIALINQSIRTGNLNTQDNPGGRDIRIGRELPVGKDELEHIQDLTIVATLIDLEDDQAEQLEYPFVDRAYDFKPPESWLAEKHE